MDFTAILNYTKKAAKSLAVGVASAASGTDGVKLVPAIAPIPVTDVDMSYGRPDPIQQDPNETERDYEEVVIERVKINEDSSHSSIEVRCPPPAMILSC